MVIMLLIVGVVFGGIFGYKAFRELTHSSFPLPLYFHSILIVLSH